MSGHDGGRQPESEPRDAPGSYSNHLLAVFWVASPAGIQPPERGPTSHFCPLISPMALPGSSVTQLLARDMDNDPLVFGVSGAEASRFFAVEPDTGVVWLRQPLDREV